MNFEWDKDKNEANITKHGLDFVDAPRIFNLPLRISLDEREDYREDRLIGLGMLDGRVVVVVYTEPDDQTIRIISLRKALPHERKRYEQYLKDELGAG
ncbi:BrnT family toxin [Coleofasciculus sp. H7-2]|uniref:BrnT family toxin n=1 Tax=Coleofasciculus sp. H7-2 TaxID=3351545 RepID=UPI00366BA2F8